MRKLVLVGLISAVLGGGVRLPVIGDVEWDVIWYHMDAPGVFDETRKLAEVTYPFQMSEDWGDAAILEFGGLCWRANQIGFQGRCEFFVAEPRHFDLELTSNNGVKLWLDETTLLIDAWEELQPDGAALRCRGVRVWLETGFHSMTLWYYDWKGPANLRLDTTIPEVGLEELAKLHQEERTAIDLQLRSLVSESAALLTQAEDLRGQLEEQRDANRTLSERILELEEELRAQSADSVEE